MKDFIKKCDDLRITSLHFEYPPILWPDFKKINIRPDSNCDSFVRLTKKSINICHTRAVTFISFILLSDGELDEAGNTRALEQHK